MHIRWSTHRRKTGVVRYAQLVESYRRGDGMPAHRVVANLGAISDLAFENFRAALQAVRDGRPVVVENLPSPRFHVRANFAYLAVAVLLRLWRELELDKLVSGVLADDADVDPSDVLAALVLQRCVAPGSKLSAVEWFPSTALPELLGILPSKFNNSRIHRVLEALDVAGDALQVSLVRRLRSTEGRFTALFLDATDTWFEGRGPALAKHGRDKVGVYRKRVGIAMVCDQRGYPLSWRVLPGNFVDSEALLNLAKELADWEWARGLPVVMDRAVGRASSVAALHAAGLRFVTALPSNEFETCGVGFDWARFDRLQLSLHPENEEDDLQRIEALAGECDFERSGSRWIRDLGVFDKVAPATDATTSRAQAAMRLALQLANGSKPGDIGIPSFSTRHASRRVQLAKLVKPIQDAVLRGVADRLPIQDLAEIAALPHDAQEGAFERAVAAAAGRNRQLATPSQAEHAALPVRGVLTLDPFRLLEERRAFARRSDEIKGVVARLNESLAKSRRPRRDDVVLNEVRTNIRHHEFGDVFTPSLVVENDVQKVVLAHNEARAAARLRVQGLSLFVSHGDTTATAPEIVELYFAKDRIEKDFQIIKGAIEIRPVHHRTDLKLRAHVSVCMLAMLLECALEERLRAFGVSRTAQRVLNTLGTCHLNLLDQGGTELYTLTERTPEQHEWLTKLNMQSLVDADRVMEQIRPR